MRLLVKTMVLGLLVLVIAAASFAQGPGGGAFGEFREKHKYTFQLMQTVRHIGEIDKDPKYALKPDQAKRMLAVLKPLRAKPNLTQDQAKQALKDIKPILTVDQLNAMARIKPMPRGGQMRSGGASGGPPGGGQGRPRMDPSTMNNFNPFYTDPKAKDERATLRAKRWDVFYTKLERESKQTKQAPRTQRKTKSNK